MVRLFFRKLLSFVLDFPKKLRRVTKIFYIWYLERKIPKKRIPARGSLLEFCSNKYSQVGQDGIIEEIFRRLQIKGGTFCEFGAWDGLYLSNARKLIEENWEGVFIEADYDRFNKLVENYPSSKIIKINALVGYQSPTKKVGEILSEILQKYTSKKYLEDLDLLIIDVDGVDLEIALSSNVRAKVMLIEGGSSFVPTINAPFPNAENNFQHPLEYIVCRMREIGYTAVCFRQDLFLVREDLAKYVIGNNAIKSAQDLFIESFYSLPRAERRWQMLRRFESAAIKDFEKSNLGEFHPNPALRLQEKD
jgi:hypothetical protein